MSETITETVSQMTPGTPAVIDPAATDPRRSEPKPFLTGAPVNAIVPRTLDELARVAAAIIKAGMAPDSYIVEPPKQPTKDQIDEAADKTKARIMIGIMKGAEVGIPPISALSTIAIINNRPCIWGDGAVALIQSRNIVDEWEERYEGEEEVSDPVSDEYGELDYAPTTRDFSDDFTAVCTIWRKGQKKPYIGRFSVRDARRAKLWNNPKKLPWVEHPKRMLKWRARAFAMRDGFADCLMGLSIREEVEDMTIEPVATQSATKDDGEFADQMAAAMMGGRETPIPVGALPAPSEQPMEIIIPQSKTPVAVENSTTTEPITVSRITPPAEPSGPAVPIVEIFKPLGARAPNWKRTREALITAFQTLGTTAECKRFRAHNSATINQLRDQAKSEWEIWQEVSATHELTIHQQEQHNVATADQTTTASDPAEA